MKKVFIPKQLLRRVGLYMKKGEKQAETEIVCDFYTINCQDYVLPV